MADLSLQGMPIIAPDMVLLILLPVTTIIEPQQPYELGYQTAVHNSTNLPRNVPETNHGSLLPKVTLLALECC